MAASMNGEDDDFRFSSDITLEDVRASQHQFCKERNWNKFHDPRNVLLAMVGEVGELAELFQWKGEVKKGLPDFSEEEKDRVGEEISDVLIYLVDLAQQCHIDLPAVVFSKMQKNAKKYPATVSLSHSAKTSIYGDCRRLVGTDVPEREREEGDGSE